MLIPTLLNIGGAEEFAAAYVALPSAAARLAFVDDTLDALRALRRHTIVVGNVEAAVSQSTRTWGTPAKDDFVDDVKEGGNGQTESLTMYATAFYEKVAELDA